MKKIEIIPYPKKLDLQLDIKSLVQEMALANLQFLSGDKTNRGAIHDAVNGIYLRGHSKQSIFGNPSLEPSNKYNEPYLECLPTIKKFLSDFPAKIIGRTALLLLDEHAQIPIHVDADPHGYFKKTLRFHVPIYTNEKVYFYNSDFFYHMAAGEVWCINNIARHGVINDGDAKRLHLVFDVFIDEEIINYIEKVQPSIAIPAKERPELMEKIGWKNRELPPYLRQKKHNNLNR